MALSEVNSRFIQQADPGLCKRWFADEEVDLTLWQEEDGRIAHFQLVLRGHDLIAWDHGRGLRVGAIQSPTDGEVSSARTYVLKTRPDESTLSMARAEFLRTGEEMDPLLREFILCALDGKSDRLEGLAASLRTPAVRSRAAARDAVATAAVPLEVHVLTLAFLSPCAINRRLFKLAGEGWELVAIGRNHAVLVRQAEGERPDLVYSVRNVTFKLPGQILRMLAEYGACGEALGGLGGSYAFFKRARNRPVSKREFRLQSVTFSSARSVLERVDAESRDGWAMAGVGANLAVLERPLAVEARRHWEHRARACCLVVPSDSVERRLQALVAEMAADRWCPCGLSSRHVFFRRPKA